MTEYWVIGGEFSSLNFHGILPNTEVVRGPFKYRHDAQDEWQELSDAHRHKAGYRFVITEAG